MSGPATAIETILGPLRAHQDRAAVGSITYGALGTYVAGVAAHLNTRGVGQDDVVAIKATRSEWLVPAMLGVWYARAAFVILDPEQPAARTELCFRQAACKFTLDASGPPQLGELKLGTPLPHPEDLAYVAFTSGSTGTPRGVVGTHGPVEHFLKWQAARFGFRSDDRFAMLSGLGHDPLLRDVLAPLRIGATLSVPGESTIRDPRSLVTWLDEERITVVHLTPTLGHLLTLGVELTGRKLENIRYFFFGGEALPRKLADICLSVAPRATVVNFYGATETPQAMGFHVYDPAMDYETPSVPIGRGIDEVDLLLEAGEILIRTRHLSRGYLNDPAATAERFVCGAYWTGDSGYIDSFGEIVFTGRRDSQIKVSGHRVEVAEVTVAMERHPEVSRALVVPSNGTLRAYFAAERITEAELRAWLKDRLPPYMIPGKLIRLSYFPMTRNGKIDIAALPPDEHESLVVWFESELEERVASMYAEVLGRKSVRRDDHFFDLGGTSLGAARLMIRLEQALGRRVPMALLLAAPTPASLAEKLSQPMRQYWSPLVILRSGDPLRIPVFFVHAIGGNVLGYRELAKRLCPRSCYGLQSVALSGQEDPDRTIEAMAARYVVEIHKAQPHGPYLLAGHSAGGLVAFEIARQLRQRDESVDAVLLFDTKIPNGERLPATLLRKISRNAIEFFRLPIAGKREFLATKWANTQTNIALAQALWNGNRSCDPKTTFQMAERLYVPGEYPGRVILFRTREGTSADPVGMEAAWSRVAPALEIRETTGNHDSMLAVPHVDKLAELVRDCIGP